MRRRNLSYLLILSSLAAADLSAETAPSAWRNMFKNWRLPWTAKAETSDCEDRATAKAPTFNWSRGPKVKTIQSAYDMALLQVGGRYRFARKDAVSGETYEHHLNFENIRNVSIQKVDDALYNISMQVSVGTQWRAYRIFLDASDELEVQGESLSDTPEEVLYEEHLLPNGGGRIFLFGQGQAVIYSRYDRLGTFSTGGFVTDGLKLPNNPIKDVEFDPVFMSFGLVKLWSEESDGTPLLRLYSVFENKVVYSETLTAKKQLRLVALPVPAGSSHVVDQAVLFAQTGDTQFKAVAMSRDAAGMLTMQVGRGEFSEIGRLDFDSVHLEIDEKELRTLHFQAALGLGANVTYVDYALMLHLGDKNPSFSLLSHAKLKARTSAFLVYEYKNPASAELKYQVYPVKSEAKKSEPSDDLDDDDLTGLLQAFLGGGGGFPGGSSRLGQFKVIIGFGPSGTMPAGLQEALARQIGQIELPPQLGGATLRPDSYKGLVPPGFFDLDPNVIPPAGYGLPGGPPLSTDNVDSDFAVPGAEELIREGESREDAFMRIHEGVALEDSYRGKPVKAFEFASNEEADFVDEKECLRLFKTNRVYAFHFKKSDSYLVVHAAKGTSFFVKDLLNAQIVNSGTGQDSLFIFSKLTNNQGGSTIGFLGMDLATGDVFQKRPVLKNVEFAHYADIPSLTIGAVGTEDFAGVVDTSIHLQDYFGQGKDVPFRKGAGSVFWDFKEGKNRRTLISTTNAKRPFMLVARNLEPVTGAPALQDRAFFAESLYLLDEEKGSFETGEAAFLFLYPPEAKGKGKEPYLAMPCPAQPVLSEVAASGKSQSYLAKGTARQLGKDVGFEFSFSPLDTTVPKVTYNKRQEAVFDSEDFEVHVSDAFENTKPQLYVRNKKFGGEAKVQDLKFVWPPVATDMPEQIKKLLCAMFGIPYVENAPIGIEANQNVKKVELRHGQHLYIETEASAAKTNITFVYDLSTSKMVAALPNLVGEHDFGDYRFLVGEANNQSSTMIALYDTKENRVLEFFDLGRFKVDPANKNAIEWNTQDQSIRFTSTEGMVRIFDLRLRNFRGKAPIAIQSEIDELAKEVGPVRSEIVFRQGVEPLRERDDAIVQLEKIFPFQRHVASRNLMIIGEAGSGKTHFFDDYLHRFLQGQLNHEPHYGIVVVDVKREIANSGTKYVGTFGDKFRKLQDIAERLNKKDFRLIVRLDNVEEMLGNADDHSVEHTYAEGDVYSQLKVLMESQVLDVVATTTAGGAGLLKRKKKAFFELFNRTLRLDSLKFEQALALAQDYLERKVGPEWAKFISLKDLRGYMETASRFSSRSFPGSVMQVVVSAVEEWQFDPNKAKPNSLKERVEVELAAKTGVPRLLLSRDPVFVKDFCARLEAFLLLRVKGQDKAIKAMVVSLRAFALGLNRRDWPLVRILSLGPTGVGKTALFKALREFLFTDEEAMKTIHGEYYQTAESAERLKELLVKHVRDYPFNITLFDEIEKMHPDVRNLVLGLADGELTDSRGNKVFASLTVFGATANVGSRDLFKSLQAPIGLLPQNDRQTLEDLAKDEARLREIFWKAAEKEFNTEQLARFDYHLIYSPLVEEVAEVIANVYLNDEELSLRRRHLDNGYDIIFDQSLVKHIVTAPEFFDYKYGARRLAIAIENFVNREFLTNAIIEGDIVTGKKYRVRFDGGLKLEVVAEPLANGAP